MRYDTKYPLANKSPHVVICDRCGAEQFDHTHFLKLTGESSEGYGHETFELCPICEKLFEKWIDEIKVQKLKERKKREIISE